jgi:hypothetical protein
MLEPLSTSQIQKIITPSDSISLGVIKLFRENQLGDSKQLCIYRDFPKMSATQWSDILTFLRRSDDEMIVLTNAQYKDGQCRGQLVISQKSYDALVEMLRS